MARIGMQSAIVALHRPDEQASEQGISESDADGLSDVGDGTSITYHDQDSLNVAQETIRHDLSATMNTGSVKHGNIAPHSAPPSRNPSKLKLGRSNSTKSETAPVLDFDIPPLPSLPGSALHDREHEARTAHSKGTLIMKGSKSHLSLPSLVPSQHLDTAMAAAAAGSAPSPVHDTQPSRPEEGHQDLPGPYNGPFCDHASYHLHDQARHIRIHTGGESSLSTLPYSAEKAQNRIRRHSPSPEYSRALKKLEIRARDRLSQSPPESSSSTSLPNYSPTLIDETSYGDTNASPGSPSKMPPNPPKESPQEPERHTRIRPDSTRSTPQPDLVPQSPRTLRPRILAGELSSSLRQNLLMGGGQFNWTRPPQPKITKTLYDRVLAQLGFYFCRKNLDKDVFLRTHMDSQGFVPLQLVAQFPRMKMLTTDYDLVREFASTAPDLELRYDTRNHAFIRRCKGWADYVLPNDQRAPSAQDHSVLDSSVEKKSSFGASEISSTSEAHTHDKPEHEDVFAIQWGTASESMKNESTHAIARDNFDNISQDVDGPNKVLNQILEAYQADRLSQYFLATTKYSQVLEPLRAMHAPGPLGEALSKLVRAYKVQVVV